MLKVLLTLVLIFVANVAIASDRFEQHDEKSSSAFCYTDSATGCSQEIDEIEIDQAASPNQASIIIFANNSDCLHDTFITESYSAYFSIRAPPQHYPYY